MYPSFWIKSIATVSKCTHHNGCVSYRTKLPGMENVAFIREVLYYTQVEYLRQLMKVWLLQFFSFLFFQSRLQDLVLPAQKIDAGDEYEGATVIDPIKG